MLIRKYKYLKGALVRYFLLPEGVSLESALTLLKLEASEVTLVEIG